MSGKQTGNIIKEIKKKPSEVIVVFESGDKLKLSFSTFTEFRLYPQKEVSEKELASLLDYEKEGEYYDYALRLLGKENYTIATLSKKLAGKGAEEKQISSIVKRLKDSGMLDDENYAKIYANDVADIRCLGRNRVMADLKEKGIASDILLSLRFDDQKELEKASTAVSLLSKRFARSANEAKKNKAIKALLNRGFSYEIALKAVEENLKANDEEEEHIQLLRDYDLAFVRFSRKFEGNKVWDAVTKYLLRKGYHYEEVSELIGQKKMEEKI